MTRVSDIIASCWIVGALLWALGAVIGAWWLAITVLAVWGALRGLPVWAPVVRSAGGVLFGDRYSDADTIREVFEMAGQDITDDVVPTVLEAARRVHNWASRTSAALIALIGMLAMWAARDSWQPFVFVVFGSAVVISATWPAIKRRWDERDA